MNRDWCQFFRDVEANPGEIVKDFTVRDMILARQHLYDCDTCNVTAQRVLASRPDDMSDIHITGLN